MSNISKNQSISFLKFLGLPESKFLSGLKVKDLYSILGIVPELDTYGSRKLTPYEILGIPPQFYADGCERPIVFFIKKRCNKIGHYDGQNYSYIYHAKKYREEKSEISQLKSEYRYAVFAGDNELAAKLLDKINELSGGKAEQILGTFLDSTIFYKKLKKQLLIDLFAHYFMMYVYSLVKSAKGGVLNVKKVFKPFRSMPAISNSKAQPEADAVIDSAISPEKFGIHNLKSITIKQPVVEDIPNQTTQDVNLEFVTNNIPVKENKPTNIDNKPTLPKKNKKRKKNENAKNILSSEKLEENLEYDYSEAEKFQSEIVQMPTYEEAADLQMDYLKRQLGEDISNQVKVIADNLSENNQNISVPADNMLEELSIPQEDLLMENDSIDININNDPINQLIEDSDKLIEDQNAGLENSEIEPIRESVIKKRKHITVKKYGEQETVEQTEKPEDKELEKEIENEFDY